MSNELISQLYQDLDYLLQEAEANPQDDTLRPLIGDVTSALKAEELKVNQDAFLPTLNMYDDPNKPVGGFNLTPAEPFDDEGKPNEAYDPTGAEAPFGGRKDVPFEDQEEIYETIKARDDTYMSDPWLGDPKLIMQKPPVDGEKQQAYLVPRPRQSFAEYYDESSGEWVEVAEQEREEFLAGALTNAPSNFMRFIGAATGLATDYAQEISSWFGGDEPDPDYVSALEAWAVDKSLDMPLVLAGDDPIQAMQMTLGEYSPGALGAISLLKAAGVSAVSTIPTLFVSELGASTTMSPDQGTLIFGDNSFFKTATGYEPGFDEGDELTPDQQLMAEKINVAMDSLVAGKLIGTGATLGVKAVTGSVDLVANSAVWLFSKNSKAANEADKAIVRGILDAIGEEAPEAIQKKLVSHIQGVLDNPQNYQGSTILNAGKAGGPPNAVQTHLSTLQALEELGVDGFQGLTEEAATALLIKIRRLKEGAAGMSETVAAREARQIDKTRKGIETEIDALGGAEATEVAGKRLADDVTTANANQIATLEAQLAVTPDDLATTLIAQGENAPQGLVESLNAWRKSNGQSAFQLLKQESVDSVRDAVIGVANRLEDARVAVYGKVQGGSFGRVVGDQVVDDTAIRALRDAVKEANRLNPDNKTLGTKVSLGPQLDNLRAMFKPVELEPAVLDEAGEVVTKAVVETEEQVFTRAVNSLNKSGTDLGVMFREVRPALRKRIDNTMKNTADVDKLGVKSNLYFLRYIDSAMDDLVSSGSATGDAAQAARRFFEEEYAPIMKDAPFDQINPILARTQTAIRTGADDAAELGEDVAAQADLFVDEVTPETSILVKAPVRQAQEVQAVIQDIVDNPGNALVYKQLYKVLDNAAPESAKELHNYVFLNVVDQLQTAIARGGVGDDFAALTEQIRKYGTSLQKTNPQEAAQVDKLLKIAESKAGTRDKVAKQLEEVKEAAKAQREEALNSVVGVFLKRQGDDVAYSGKPREAVQKIVNSEDSAKLLGELVAKAKATGDPRVLEGLQSEYLRNLHSKIFTKGGALPTGGAKVSDSNLTKELGVLANDKGMLSDANLKAIFPDDPQLREGLVGILKSLQKIDKTSAAGRATVNSNTTMAMNMQQKLEKLSILTTVIWGRLNRRGAVAQSVGGKLIRDDARAINSGYKPTVAKLLADPTEFKRVIDLIAKEDAYLAGSRAFEELVSTVSSFMLNKGIVRSDGGQFTLSEEEMMAFRMQVEEDMAGAENAVTTDQQTEEVLR